MPTETIWLAAKVGPLPSNWWEQPAPSPPAWFEPLTTPWVQVISGPTTRRTWYRDENGVQHFVNEPVGGEGVLFDPLHPERHGIHLYLKTIKDIGGGYTAVETNASYLDDLIAQYWGETAAPQRQWMAATTSDAKPSNTTWRWVKITHAPGTGPSIEGQPTERGRGTIYQQRGSLPRREAGKVIIYQLKQDHPSGWLAEVSPLEGPTPPLQPAPIPNCPPSEAVYGFVESAGGWPGGNQQPYLCGIPDPYWGPLNLLDRSQQDQLCGGDGSTRFKLSSERPPPPAPQEPGSPGSPAPPSGSSNWPAYCGDLVKDPEGVWLPATFFNEAPVGATSTWVQILDAPGHEGRHFGRGILHVRNRFTHKWGFKIVLIVEIANPSHPGKARIVPNSDPIGPDKPTPPAGSPGLGFAPFQQPTATKPAKLRPNPIHVRRRSRFGYFVGVPVVLPPAAFPTFVQPVGCPPPLIDAGTRIAVTGRWATACFMPAYHRARLRWDGNATAIGAELMLELVPQAAIGPARTAAEQELRRRIDLAVAVLLNSEGVVVPYPPSPPTPRPPTNRRQPAWLRALTTGWA